MKPALETLQQHVARLHRGAPRRERLSTGVAELDERLPDGGWPLGALTEVLCAGEGIGELRLVLSALAELSRRERWIVWVNPPYVPYAPALVGRDMDLSRVLVVHAQATDALWAAEQALRSATCGAVLLWSSITEGRSLRRLQLAAEHGGSWGVLFRGHQAASQPSPSALRLRLAPTSRGLEVEILKCRGRAPAAPLVVATG
ncbi:MAG: translesion DNA synthesis-associated protein ImuA [Gammaproteobacteria bacterium]|nr:translesion DNA synthesis-associated protein ImuA [Gammaproteobacteria bacterium]